MDLTGLIEKYRDKIVNLGILLIALFIALNIYQFQDKQAGKLESDINMKNKKCNFYKFHIINPLVFTFWTIKRGNEHKVIPE